MFTLRCLALLSFCCVALRAAEPAVIDLWPEGVPDLRADASDEKDEGNGRISNVHHPRLTVYPAPADRANGTGVIVCPGGGYVRLAMEHEGAAVARWLNSLGVSAYVLRYRMVEYGHPAPLRDILRSVRLLRSRASEFGLNPERIGVLGFSAGGHLAASAGTLFEAPEGKTGAALDTTSARPDFMILLYPVITMTREPYVHAGSRRGLLGPNPTAELQEHLSMELQVRKDTPPAFIVHTEEDKSVPVKNSLLFYEALQQAGVSAELHIFEKGPHGFGLRPDLGPTSEWPARCETWLRFHGWLTPPEHPADATPTDGTP
jgi:acetyl esterase/lipase